MPSARAVRDAVVQYFAANGYFVLDTNFRSSTGYGEKFLWGTWGAWGTKDGQDVIILPAVYLNILSGSGRRGGPLGGGGRGRRRRGGSRVARPLARRRPRPSASARARPSPSVEG